MKKNLSVLIIMAMVFCLFSFAVSAETIPTYTETSSSTTTESETTDNSQYFEFKGGQVKATIDATDNTIVTFTAIEGNTFTFCNWTIAGEYTVLDGNLHSYSITVQFTDATTITAGTAVPIFGDDSNDENIDDDDSDTIEEDTTVANGIADSENPANSDKKSTSPKTGDNLAVCYELLIALTVGSSLTLLASRVYKTNKKTK